MRWLDINLNSLSVDVSTEGDFQTPGAVIQLQMDYDNIADIHFEDRTSEHETSTMKSHVNLSQEEGRKTGPPVMQVRTNMFDLLWKSLILCLCS